MSIWDFWKGEALSKRTEGQQEETLVYHVQSSPVGFLHRLLGESVTAQGSLLALEVTLLMHITASLPEPVKNTENFFSADLRSSFNEEME